MHSHDTFSVETLPDPAPGDQPVFWDDGTQYTLKPQDDRWVLYGHFRPGKASPLGVVRRSDRGWEASELNSPGLRVSSDLVGALRFLM